MPLLWQLVWCCMLLMRLLLLLASWLRCACRLLQVLLHWLWLTGRQLLQRRRLRLRLLLSNLQSR